MRTPGVQRKNRSAQVLACGYIEAFDKAFSVQT